MEKMSEVVRSPRRSKPEPLMELDIDDLVERLTPGEIQQFLDDIAPDDSSMPAALRCNYKCDKNPTGPFDKQKLLDYIYQEAISTPDLPESVPFVPGTVRGKKFIPRDRPVPANQASCKSDFKIELDVDLEEEFGNALASASISDIVDLAGILGFHSLINQDQFHASQSGNFHDKLDDTIGWNGVTKATPLKSFPPEQPNLTDPDEVISKMENNASDLTVVNLNNVSLSDAMQLKLMDALKQNQVVRELYMSNTGLRDSAATLLAGALQINSTLKHLNIESNSISPLNLVKIFEAANVQQTLTEIKASNQKARFLGNKVEMAITKAIESNKSLLKIGLHLEFGDCRNRVAVQLQKNLDRIRLKRIAPFKLTGSRTAGILGHLPGQLLSQHQSGRANDDDESSAEEEDR